MRIGEEGRKKTFSIVVEDKSKRKDVNIHFL